MTPIWSTSHMFSRLAPMETSRLRHAMPAAPPPVETSLISESSLSTMRSPFRNAAAVTIAVPCWSSWKTGIFMRSRHFCSMMKHSGALMSSRLIAPKVGSSAQTISTILSASVSSSSMSKTSIEANFLNNTALPSITGFEASGPMAPRPNTAVPLVITATRFWRAVRLAASVGSAAMASHAAATPGE